MPETEIPDYKYVTDTVIIISFPESASYGSFHWPVHADSVLQIADLNETNSNLNISQKMLCGFTCHHKIETP